MDMTALDRAEHAGAEMLRLTTLAHTVIQDLKAVIADGRLLQREIKKAVEEQVGGLIDDTVKAGLDEYQETLEVALKRADKAMDERFTKLTDILLGEDKKSKAQGKLSLTELVEQRKSR
jgi:hypothetical protein